MEYFDLTTPQQNIWNLQKYYEDTAISNLCGAVFYKERRDHVLLQKAIRQFIENQSSMRLHFCEDGSPKQYLLDKADVDIPVLEFPSMEAFDQYAEGFAGKALGLLNGNMFRFAVFYVEEKSGILVVLSHFIADAWTFGLLANQLDAAYLNLSAQGTRQLIKADYRDFIYSENEYLTSNRFQKDKSYWEEKYTIPPERSPIKPNLSPSASIQAKRRTSVLPLALEQRLKEYGKTYSVTPAVLFETALIIYLSKINPENQSITIGVPVLNRKNVLEKNIAGMFISTMPLTVSVDTSMSVLDLAKQISKGHMDLFRHQKYPYTEILKFLREKKGFSGHIYDVMVSYQNAKTHTGADTKWYTNGYSEIPLVIHIDNRDEHESHTVHMDYQTEVFEQTEIQYLAGRLEYILTQMLAEHSRLLSEIKWIPDQELTKILFDFNDTCTDYPREKCVHELFEEQARRTPDKVAIISHSNTLTYRELNEYSNQIAHNLVKIGIRVGDIVAFSLPRTSYLIAVILGILKTGAAYLPVGLEYPHERINNILYDSNARFFITEKNIRRLLVNNYTNNLNINVSINNLCYCIYTSGSTGQAKGVMISNKNLIHYLFNIRKIYGKLPINMPFFTNINVDLSVTSIFLPLITAGKIFIYNEDISKSLKLILENNDLTIIKLTPIHLKIMCSFETKFILKHIKHLIVGGETLYNNDVIWFRKKYGSHINIHNEYGPTEATVGCCDYVFSDNNLNSISVPIGHPIANTQIYLLDADKNPVPIGVPGELYIAGDGVGLGYLNRPELTAERFVPNPFATKENHHGKTMYQTGDLARCRADGELEYLGRIDTQVKIRGLRIELGEIESAMSGFPGILLAAATDGRDENGRQYLTGYYTADKSIEEKALRSHLSAKLPKYMIPNYFVHLDAMPMTPSGKTDRRNLPKPDFTMQERAYTPPETETEKRLAFIWEHLMELPRVGREDDFFELGGDSLTAVSLLNEIETEFHVEISIQDIMEKTLLEQLAAYVEQAPALQRIKASHKEKYLLLPQQKAIYAACMKDPDTLVYNMPAKMILPDTIDRERLKQSITRVFNHHRMLKSCIRAEDSQLYGIYDKDAQIVFEEYQSGEESAFVRPFSLEQAPLMRIGFTDDALLFDLHHIIADGDSLNIILRDIADAYDGKPLSSPEIDYSDYADYFYSLNTEEHKAYFKEMLQCDMEPVVLPETGKASVGGHSKLYQIPEELFTKARQYARKNGLTDTMVFLGAYGILLSRYTGKKDILSSIILQNRIHAETRDLVGMFVNTLPLCLTLQDDTTEYMQKVKQRLLNLFRYQELPFEDILETVGKEKRPAANTAFVYQGDGEKALFLEGKRLIPRPLSTHTAKFDLSMELTPIKEGCLLRLEYCQGKYKEEFIDSLAQSYLHILKQLDKKKLTHISVLSKEMYHRIIEEFNDTYVEYRKDKCIHELFTEQAARTPDKTALIFEDRSFTYRELDEMSNSLAHFLRERGIGPNDVVPIIAKRSWHILVAMLGVLKAGGAYMPIDPNYPEDRIHYMFWSAKSKLVLEYGYRGKLDWETIKLDRFNYGKNTTALENINTPEDPSYVIFTSGSTGNPKGVTICHQNISNYTHNNNNNNVCHHIIQNQYESIVSVTNIVFDIFVTETLLPLVNGLCIYFVNDEEVASQEKLSRLLERNKIDVLQTTPTKMRSYILNKSNTEYLQKLKAIILGGEAFPQDLFHTLKSYTDADIYNIYGPAETTVWSTNAEITGSDITIGRPIANTQIYLLDADKNPVPIGVPGELYIAGDGVGLGYLNRPELTAERFVPNPFATKENHHGKIMYQTGDLARWRADGELEYLGRIDTQVKIRGLRIELGEIESAMSGFPGILLAAATDGRDENGRQYLTGYYTADENIEEKALRSHLSAKLPKYMIPNYFVHLNVMPMTPSGKTDRRNLPKPDFTMQERTYTAPKTETERKLCGLLEELLSLEPIGTQDDFFELGGDSLTAMEYMAKSHSMGIDFSLQDIFDYPTVQSLCESLTKGIVPGIQYNASDFEPYQCLLAQNQIEENFIPKKKSLGHVLLTGATGFLGSHVLEQLLRRETGHIYCLIRGESEAKCREKLSNTLQYYFGAQYQNEIGTRILPIMGDIEQEGFAGNLPEQIQTIIHTAASVRHYGSYEYFRRVNVEGTCRMIDWAKKAGAKFIHISTLSVSGNSLADNFSVYRSWEEQFFYESSLYIGQPLDNVYIHSKFEAEKAVYDAMLQGLDAKVIRVGNLTNRASDFKFQPNYRENAFLTREKALLEFGLFPDYLMPLYSEFSPVDLTAEGIVKIAQYADRQTVFHLYSNRPVYFDRFLEIIHALGISMKVVNGDEFSRALNQTILNPDREYIYEAFQNDLDEDGRLLYDSRIHIVNDFTVWFLKQIGFEWNATDAEYLTGYINYFRNLGYFKV